jgi:hypothetical protein
MMLLAALNLEESMWHKISKISPNNGQRVIAKTYDDGIVVGFWNDYENCVLQFEDDTDGWKWSIVYWMPITDLQQTDDDKSCELRIPCELRYIPGKPNNATLWVCGKNGVAILTFDHVSEFGQKHFLPDVERAINDNQQSIPR